MANLNLVNSSNIQVVQNDADISLDLTTTGSIGDLTQLTTTDKDSLVDAINEVNGKILTTWTYVDTKTGNTTISIPNGATELYILCKIDNNDNLAVPFYIPIRPTSAIRVNGGYWQNTTYGGRIAVDITTSTVGIFYSYLNGSSVISNSSITLYYR